MLSAWVIVGKATSPGTNCNGLEDNGHNGAHFTVFMEANIELRMLTPLWTGGVETGKMDRIHETGIIGSLRWWYEAIVRGLGGDACDPATGKCQFNAENYKKSQSKVEHQRLRDAGLCDVCQIFGATGWRRRFRLVVADDQTHPIWSQENLMLNIRPAGRTRGWYLPPGKMGSLILRFIGEAKEFSMLSALFLFIEKWGSLGAKPQLGYGVFEIINREIVLKKAQEWKWVLFSNNTSTLPDIWEFGFVKFRFQPPKSGWWTEIPGFSRVGLQVQPLVTQYSIAPVSPALKNEFRFNRWQRSWGSEREIFGSLQPERRRSRLVVSWAYSVNGSHWETRGWVCPPFADKNQPTGALLQKLFSDEAIWNHVLHVKGILESRYPATTTEVLQLLEESVI